jgi:hypothetical protein
MAEPEGVVAAASTFEVSYVTNQQIFVSKVQHDDVPIFGINQKFQMVVETLRDFVCVPDFYVENLHFALKTIHPRNCERDMFSNISLLLSFLHGSISMETLCEEFHFEGMEDDFFEKSNEVEKPVSNIDYTQQSKVQYSLPLYTKISNRNQPVLDCYY